MLLLALILLLTASLLWMASKSAIEAGRGHVVLGVDMDPLIRGLEAAQQKFAAWGKGMEAAGAGMAAAGTAMQAPFVYALHVLTEDGNHLWQVARQTGISIAELGPLAYATGGDLDALATAVRKMNGFLEQASHGSHQAQAALSELGLSFDELNGLTEAARFERIADALSHVADAGQRSALQTQILGRDAGSLNLSGGAAGLHAREANAQRLGVLSPADVALARELSVAERELGVATRATWGFVGAAVAPYMTQFVRQVTEIVLVIQHWVRDNGPLLLTLFKIAEWVTILGTVLGGLGVAIYGASFAFGFLAGLVPIVSGAMGALSGMVMFAATGFGILNVWTWATAAAMIAYNAAAWLVNGAHAVGIAALALFTGSTVAAQAGTHAFSLALIVAWIWENIASVGIYLLVTALGVLVVALLAIGGVGLVLVLAAIVYGVGQLISATEAWAHITDSIGDAANSAWGSCRTAFAGIFDTVKTTMGGVMDAVTAGDWALVWEIVKVAAQIAWAQITLFVKQQLFIWSTTARDIWHTIADALEDAFAKVITSVRVMWSMMAGYLASVMHTALAAVYRAAETGFRAIGMTTRADAAHDAAAASTTAASAATNGAAEIAITAAANAEQLRRTRAREERDRLQAELDAAEEDELVETAETAALRERLQSLREEAAESAAMRGMTFDDEQPGQGTEGFASQAKAGAGSFFADALSGMFGAGGATVQDRQLRAQNLTNQLLEDIARRLNAMDGGAFA